jgi:UDP-N-acetylmuramoyl-L-alanyl-D-glutamate--2,6-diaminopimelate ligase
MNLSHAPLVSLRLLVQALPDLLNIKPGLQNIPDISITGVQFDSRKVVPGDLFVALVGESADGHRFIPSAIAAGALAIVGEQPGLIFQVPYLQVSNSRRALAYLASAFYNFPASKLRVIGVTGTDGKTTTANLIYQILRVAGLPAGLISTVNAVIGEQTVDTGFHVTTPEATDVQRLLFMMDAQGLTHVVLEATSHGLAQHRVTASEFDIGVVTNITHEHLDYHQTYEAYRAAKATLFDLLAPRSTELKDGLRIAILNRDDLSYSYLVDYLRSPKLTRQGEINAYSYGIKTPGDMHAEDIHLAFNGIEFTAVGPGFRFPVQANLPGEYNISNCLAAIAATVIGLKIDPQAAAEGIHSLQPVPGRMEILDLGTDFMTIVDFAHTPNALHRVLTTLRGLLDAQGRGSKLISVFGSAGLRDKTKRRMMAEISAELSDFTVLTAEDPRTESLEDILAEMAEGCREKGCIEGKNFWRIPDRGDAIRFALRLAQAGDAVISLGKGHEQSMCFGEIEYPWDDRGAMRSAVAEYLGISGPAMPYLPTQG